MHSLNMCFRQAYCESAWAKRYQWRKRTVERYTKRLFQSKQW